MKRLLFLAVAASFFAACGGNPQPEKNPFEAGDASPKKEAGGNPSYDPERGTGKFTHVDVAPALDAAMAGNGQKVYEVKCNSCHKLTNEKLVGPGWKDVTKRYKPEWIMNFITNTDEML